MRLKYLFLNTHIILLNMYTHNMYINICHKQEVTKWGKIFRYYWGQGWTNRHDKKKPNRPSCFRWSIKDWLTSISSEGYLFLSVRTLSIVSGMNFCPPNPGSTVITRTMSTWISPSTCGLQKANFSTRILLWSRNLLTLNNACNITIYHICFKS